MVNPQYEHFKGFSSGPATMEERKKIWLEISGNMTGDQFDAMMAANRARQPRAPEVGAEAPDFKIERLTRDRKRTGEFVGLSALRGRPVALIFGSYT